MNKKVVVLSGAGISAESGIKTFRDSDGLWANYRIEDVATYQAWERNPKMVIDFYNTRRQEVISAVPNAAHYALVDLEKNFNTQIITQNIDDLHERAGSSQVLHLHGEIKKLRSDKHPEYTVELETWKQSDFDVDPWGEPLRPHIVWFGESVPLIETAAEICQHADYLMVIGTSLQVYPAAGLLGYVPRMCSIYLIDPKEVHAKSTQITYIQEVASVGVKKAIDMILTKEQLLSSTPIH